jgi:CcmD family protein
MESLPTNFPYLFAAYAAIWTALFFYLFRLLKKEKELRAQLESLVAELEKERSETSP